MLNNKVDEKLNELINYIINSPEYKKCIQLKKEMSENKKIITLIDEIKLLQKKYIKTNDDINKKVLDDKILELNSIPLYNEYNNSLSYVNDMISYVKDELNEYFYQKLNI